MNQTCIKATVVLDKSLWVVLFERMDKKKYSAARAIFGEEPSDPELYEFISIHFYELKFTKPQNFRLIIKRKNPKRMHREVRKEMEKAKAGSPKTTRAHEVLRVELEKNKKLKKTISRAEKEKKLQEKFVLHQVKKKKKKRGH